MRLIDNFLKTLHCSIFIKKEDRPYILLIPLVLTVAYSLYIFIPFGASDDYARAWYYIISPQTFGINELKSNFTDGRLFNGLFLWLFYRPNSISYLGVYRLINLFLLFIFSLTLFYFLSKEIDKLSASLLTIIICLLPSFSIMFYFASLMGVVAGGVFSGLSVWLLIGFRSIPGLRIASVIRLFFSSLFLLIAVQFYQPIAMIFWVFVAIILAFDHLAEIRQFLKKYFLYLAVFIFTMLIDFLIIRATPGITGLSNSRTATVSMLDLAEKIDWFIQIPLVNSFNFFLLLRMPQKIVIGAILFIFVGLYLWFNGSMINRLVKATLLLSFIPFSYLPNLVVHINEASLRSMIALSSIWVIFIYFGSKGFNKWLSPKKDILPKVGKFVLVLWGGFAIFFSIYNSTAYTIIPSFIEHRYIHAKIASMQLKAGDNVYVPIVNYADGTSPYVYYGEVGFPTIATSWGGQNLTNLVIREFGFSPNQIKVWSTDDPKKVSLSQPGNHLLDFQTLKDFQLKGSMYPIERIKIIIDSIFQKLVK